MDRPLYYTKSSCLWQQVASLRPVARFEAFQWNEYPQVTDPVPDAPYAAPYAAAT